MHVHMHMCRLQLCTCGIECDLDGARDRSGPAAGAGYQYRYRTEYSFRRARVDGALSFLLKLVCSATNLKLGRTGTNGHSGQLQLASQRPSPALSRANSRGKQEKRK